VRSIKRVVDGVAVTYRAYLVLTEPVAAPGAVRDDILFSWRVASAKVREREWRLERSKQDGMNDMFGSKGTGAM
jgi:hypothetical protein